MAKITVQNTDITVLSYNEHDYISLTDMANAKESESRAADIIKNWIRNRYTIEFLGTWEMIHNPNFKVVEFDHFKSEAGLYTFTLSAKEWIERTNAIGIYVQAGRYGGTYVLPKRNYKKDMEWLVYADEADLLNVVLFDCTAKEWREANPVLAKNSNIRDYASISELTVLSNLETHNAELIKQGYSKKERFEMLQQIAQYQLKVLAEAEQIKQLPDKTENQ